MDYFNETLTHNSLDLKFEPSIHATLRITKETLNHYYDTTYQSEVYCIVMGVFHFVLPPKLALTTLISVTSSSQTQAFECAG